MKPNLNFSFFFFPQTTKSSKTPHLRYNHRPARNKFQSESSDFAPIRPMPKSGEQPEEDYDDDEDDEEILDDDDSSDFEIKKVKDETPKIISVKIVAPPAKSPPIEEASPVERQDERDFMKRLNDFMTQQSLPMPKLAWMGLRDGECCKTNKKKIKF
jgi:hypothetical protein